MSCAWEVKASYIVENEDDPYYAAMTVYSEMGLDTDTLDLKNHGCMWYTAKHLYRLVIYKLNETTFRVDVI